jgi:hypothetical protein
VLQLQLYQELLLDAVDGVDEVSDLFSWKLASKVFKLILAADLINKTLEGVQVLLEV